MLYSKQMQLEKVHTNDNRADMLTKMVTRKKLEVCRQLAGMAAGRQLEKERQLKLACALLEQAEKQ